MQDERGYQLEYSRINPMMHSSEGRQRKAETMLRVLGEALGDRLATAHVLNLGCSTGLIDAHLAPSVGQVTGVDIDEPGLSAARAMGLGPNVRFLQADAMDLPFDDGAFDVVICSQVYEHVPDAGKMMSEIRRVLRDGGVCYFAATNRWSVIEQHYRLPFLSWLPQRLANLYVRVLGRSDAYYERHFGVPTLRRMVAPLAVEDWTGRLLTDPGRYGVEYMFPGRFALLGARMVHKFAYWFFPGFIWLLWKAPGNPGAKGAE